LLLLLIKRVRARDNSMTTTISYQSLALQWEPRAKTDRPFLLIVIITISLALLLAIIVNSITVPKQTIREKIKVPDRVAQFILDKPKPVVPPPAPVIEKPKPQPKKKPKITKKQVKEEVVLTQKQEEARKTATESGLLALSEEFTDLIDTSDIDNMVGQRSRKVNVKSTMANVDTTLLTDNVNQGSGGAVVGDTFAQAGGAVTLDESQISVARTLLTSRVKQAQQADDKPQNKTKKARTGNYRPQEEIAFVMDKNKGKLHSLYRRARRSDPSIQGKIILDITIDPDGKVIKVVMKSSELNNSKLEARIISRVKQFKFGVANVKTVTVTYPIEFLPS